MNDERAECDVCGRPLATTEDWRRTFEEHGGVRTGDDALCWTALGILRLDCEKRRAELLGEDVAAHESPIP